MSGIPLSIRVTEWDSQSPDTNKDLAGRFLEDNAQRRLVEILSQAGMLEIRELRNGLMVRTFSHVGRVRLGNVEITVQPKLDQRSLLNLLRYAYGFRKLKLLPETAHHLEQSGFADLLVSQLLAEAGELVARGLHRTYVSKAEWLPTPKGRIDVQRLVARGGAIEAALPCVHHPRVEDSNLNRVLLAGLGFAASVASDIQLRREARRLTSLLSGTVSSIQLDAEVLQACLRNVNRLTVAYEPALSVIRLLWEAQGVSLSSDEPQERLPGFLFDMNRFFQALVSRFLHDGLPAHTVRDEHRLRGMMHFVPGFNPRNRRPPAPRPDFVILRGNRQVAMLDAKYRDLWEKSLPRAMLYQLGIYAVGQDQGSATILFPTLDRGASEARIDIRDALHGRPVARINLRPVILTALQEMALARPSPMLTRKRQALAEWLAFGADASPVDPPRVSS